MPAPLPPQPTVLRAQPRVASQVQDSTLANYTATQNVLAGNGSAIAALQQTTAPGTVSAGILVTATLPATGAYVLVTHNLGYVASGFVVVSKGASLDVFRDPKDPGAVGVSSQPTQANQTPTKTIRLQSTAMAIATVRLWIF